jgi:aldehyde dehydrogenase (NAD+)
VTGDHSVAHRLAEQPSVSAVTVTGSLAAGRAMQEICGRRFLPLQAELSGNNAAIVWDRERLAVAAGEIARGAFGFAGQRCTANRRAILPADWLDDFLEQIVSSTWELFWGDPLDNATDIGPMISAARRDEHESMIHRLEAESPAGRVIRLFDSNATELWIQRGAYARPAVVVCCDPAQAIVQEETMSPLLVVQPARDFDHALELTNGVRHGLIASLFAEDHELQDRFLAGAQAGILKINSATAGVDVRLPFGGVKSSSVGPPEHGEGDVAFYTRWQAVYGCP